VKDCALYQHGFMGFYCNGSYDHMVFVTNEAEAMTCVIQGQYSNHGGSLHQHCVSFEI